MSRTFHAPKTTTRTRSRRLTRVAAVPALASLSLAGLAAVTTPAAVAAPIQYVALGDSFAGGEGVPADLSGFDAGSGECHRAAGAWPRLLATAKGLSLEATNGLHTTQTAGHVACTAASATSLLVGGNSGEPAQVAQLRTISPRPGLVTLTIGATDARIRSVMLACRTDVTCSTTISQARTLVRGILVGRLARTFAQVKAASSARLIVVGYPQLYAVPNAGVLAQCPGADLGHFAELRAYGKDLDTTMALAARAAGVEYVSTLDVLAGHELCTPDPMVNGVEVSSGELTAASGHPTASGHQAIAQRVASWLTRYPAAPNLAPKPAFTYKRKNGTASKVVLDASGSRDPDGRIIAYVWRAGGTVIARGKIATITVARRTTVKVTLTVTDNRGAKVSLARTVSGASTTAR